MVVISCMVTAQLICAFVLHTRKKPVFLQGGSYIFINKFLITEICNRWCICLLMFMEYEPRREKTGFLHMRKQRRRSASR